MHDRSRFYVIGFSLRRSDGSEWRDRIEKGFDEFYDIAEGTSTLDLA
jgi:predicted O-linked N-acetylglucosamine transferase (SPINDLY family)